ncbi:hypothetical protein WJX73_004352 [Symbiochloris irregularis]|uniref:Calponin-homology (CH) domain-containing protein n=1 Tax=Symbiochloris irregularis TaxID=706552 RepID=A0AAW1NSU6_9CHLO
MGAGASQPALARRHTFHGNEIELGALSEDMAAYPLRKYTSFQPSSSYLYESSSDSGHLVGNSLAPVGEEPLVQAPPQYGTSSFAQTLARAQMDRSNIREALARVSEVPGAEQALAYLQRNSTGNTSERKKTSSRRHPAAVSSPDSPHSTTSDSGLEQLKRFPRGDVGHIRRRSQLGAGQPQHGRESVTAELSRESSEVELVPTQLGSASEVEFMLQLIQAWLPFKLPENGGGGTQLVAACQDGILLSQMLMACMPDSIDPRALNMAPADGSALLYKQALENATLCLNAAMAMGCMLAHVAPADIVTGQERSIFDCAWQILRLGLLKDINVKQTPQLVLLRGPEEDPAKLMDAPPEPLLLRWLNYHLTRPQQHRHSSAEPDAGTASSGEASAPAPGWWGREPVTNFSRDLADGVAMMGLLHSLAPEVPLTCSSCEDEQLDVRWRAVVAAAQQVCNTAMPAPHLLAAGNARMHLSVMALLFKARQGLEAATRAAQAQLAQFVAWLEEYEVVASREERVFSVWITSLLNTPLRAGLFDSLRDGTVLLRVIDVLSPGAVDWRYVRKQPLKPLLRRVHSLENCNQAVAAVRRLLQLPLVNIEGLDIVDAQGKLVLAILWQLMRFHIRRLLAGVSSQGPALSDAELDLKVLSWANAKAAGGGSSISSFGDKQLASGVFLGHLLAAVQPGSIDLAMLAPGNTPRDLELNAKYIISSARKLGSSIFLVWEDIAEVNSKMILVLIASIMALDMKNDAALTTH